MSTTGPDVHNLEYMLQQLDAASKTIRAAMKRGVTPSVVIEPMQAKVRAMTKELLTASFDAEVIEQHDSQLESEDLQHLSELEADLGPLINELSAYIHSDPWASPMKMAGMRSTAEQLALKISSMRSLQRHVAPDLQASAAPKYTMPAAFGNQRIVQVVHAAKSDSKDLSTLVGVQAGANFHTHRAFVGQESSGA
mmetsp:Transcript_133283/g.231589  ORF Transcript_133283/g.231589 Transcript_133283/m.231589 type:complete len:195 (+) Transcript_133283:88-672(+)